MVLAGDRDALFLHRLQQSRLGARTGAVDFVGHEKLAKHRALDKAESAFSVGVLQNLGAQNIGRHQVRRELHPLVSQPQHRTQGIDQQRLSKAREADQQNVTACQQRDKGFVDNLFLAVYDAAYAVANRRETLSQRLDVGNQLRRRLGGIARRSSLV